MTVGGKRVTIAGHCKGSGMIAPNMATMLAYVGTDAAVDSRVLGKLVREVTDQSFNCVTVDQHTSTSDTFVVMANGMAGNKKVSGGAEAAKFGKALLEVCDSLARQIARDGEGATKLVTVVVTGAKSAGDAKRAAEAVANSPLCKTAIHGGDPELGAVLFRRRDIRGRRCGRSRGRARWGRLRYFQNGRQPTAVGFGGSGEGDEGGEADDLGGSGDGGEGKKGVWASGLYVRFVVREYITINGRIIIRDAGRINHEGTKLRRKCRG